MTFTQIPPEYAPLSGELRYTVTTQETATLDLRIADAGNGTLIGAKRFAGVTSASFDAAPYLRRAVAFVPTTGSTGFRMGRRAYRDGLHRGPSGTGNRNGPDRPLPAADVPPLPGQT